MIYTIRAEVGPSSGDEDWFKWAESVGWTWVEKADNEHAYELQTSDLKVVGENIVKLFESRIEAEVTGGAAEKVGAVWQDSEQSFGWNYYYDNGE